jgi:hypothetical protein
VVNHHAYLSTRIRRPSVINRLFSYLAKSGEEGRIILMASVSSSDPLRSALLLALVSFAAAFTVPSASYVRLGGVGLSGRCSSRISLRASAAPAAGDSAKGPDQPIDRFNSKQFASETAVVTSRFVGDDGFEKNFVGELEYWTTVRQKTMDEFKKYKSAQEELLKTAMEKLEDAQGKQESLSFIPFMNLDKPVNEAQAEVSLTLDYKLTSAPMHGYHATDALLRQVDRIKKELETQSQKCFTEMQVPACMRTCTVLCVQNESFPVMPCKGDL